MKNQATRPVVEAEPSLRGSVFLNPFATGSVRQRGCHPVNRSLSCLWALACIIAILFGIAPKASAQAGFQYQESAKYLGAGQGVRFSVYSAYATSVSVVGQFNGWNGSSNPMTKGADSVWTTTVTNAQPYQEYKFLVNGSVYMKDPLSLRVVDSSSGANSIIENLDAYTWSSADSGFQVPPLEQLVIYELHLPSFMSKNDGVSTTSGQRFNNFVTHKLDYLKALGVNCIEIMPIHEFPGEVSWGYNPVYYHAPESSFGSPWDFQRLVDECHKRGIAVILDVVYNHTAGNDNEPLWNFENRPANLLDSAGGNLAWYYPATMGPTIYGPEINYGSARVRSALVDDARLWVDKYHVDGFRFDFILPIRRDEPGAEDGEGNPDPNGEQFLRELTNAIRPLKNNKLIVIAEDHAGDSFITRNTSEGGLGFMSQWQQMYDLINVMSAGSDNDRNMNTLQFLLGQTIATNYGGHEIVKYHTSHDQAAQSQGQRYPNRIGDPGNWAVKRRSLLSNLFVLSGSGIPMLFMGDEFYQTGYWSDNPNQSGYIDWNNLTNNATYYAASRDLIWMKTKTNAMRSNNCSVEVVDNTQKYLVWRRWNGGSMIQFAANLTAFDKTVSIPFSEQNATFTHLMSTGWSMYGGSDSSNAGQTTSSNWFGTVTIPAYGFIAFSSNQGLPPLAVASATPSNGQSGVGRHPDITWTAATRASSYKFYIGTSFAGVNDATEANSEYKGQTGATTFAQSNLGANTTYYWRADSVNSWGTTKGSVFSFTTTNATVFPGPWTEQDIGNTAIAGSDAYLDGIYSLTASGADIWGTADGFHFVHQEINGDSMITARVDSVQNTDPWAKAGLMFRNDTTAGSVFANVVVTPANGVSFQWRASAGGSCSASQATGITPPVWLQLRRSGNSFSAWYGSDGSNWTQIGGNTAVTMNATVRAGLAHTSHNQSVAGTAQFSRVSVLATPWASSDIGSTGEPGSANRTTTGISANGSGADIWGTSDSFQYVHRSIDGSASLVARVESQQGTDSWAKSGLMIRNDLGAGAVHAAVLVTPGNGVTFQWRSSAGGSCSNVEVSGVTAPVWLKIERYADSFSAWYGSNGSTWTQIGSSVTLPMNYYGIRLGLAVCAHNNSVTGNAAFGNLSLTPLTPPPAAPTGLSATAGNAQVSLSWSASNGATSYNIKRSTTSGGPYSTVGTATVTNYVNTGLTNGTTYHYVVTAVNSGGESGNSSQSSTTPQPPPPAAPSSLNATAGNTQVSLSWPASSGASSYNVKRSTSSGGPYTTVANVTGTSHVNTGLINNTTYHYVVSAVNGGGESGNSPQASATPQPPPPTAPTGLAATPGNTQVSLTWNASSGAASYNVKRSTVSGGPYTTITNVTGTTFVNTGLTNGTIYYFVVSGVNTGGEGSNSSQASATPQPPPPAAPSNLVATAGEAQVSLSWSASSGATSYNVKRSAISGGPFTTIGNVTGTSYLNTGLAAGTTYYYVVSALNGGGESANSVQASDTTAPAVPGGLATTPGDGQVTVSWNGSTGATNYKVKRSATSGGPYTTITTVTTTSYTDTGLANGSAYYYVVLSANAAGESSNSSQVTGAPNGMPTPWTNGDVGSVGLAGSATHGSGTFTLNGSGSDIWGTADSFHYVSQPLDGSASLVARIESQQNTDPWAKAGGMIRNDLTAGSAFAGAFVTPGSGVVFQWRSTAGGACGSSQIVGVTAPVWVKIERLGDSFSAWYGSNGTTWTQIGSSVTIAMNQGVRLGMAVCAHNNTVLGNAVLSNLAITPLTPPPAAPTGLAVTPGDGQVALSWNASAGATSYNVKRSTTSGGPYTTIATVTTTSHTDLGLVNGVTYHYVVSATNVGGEGTNSSQTTGAPNGMPSPWATIDVGAVGATGSATHSGGTFTVNGSGWDIWDAADEFRYVYQSSSGTCEMKARVATQQNTDPWAKTGVVIRESTAAGARYAGVFITPGNGVVFQRRTATGGTTATTVVTGVTAPRWVRIQRNASDSFAGYYSSDGVNWTQIGTNQTVTMSSTATLGMAVSSHNDGVLNTSSFTNVTATP